ncbi:MAG: hypothetical protein ACRET8_10780, partial [Burkholderiales bacterium]
FVAPRLFPRARGPWQAHALPAHEFALRMLAGAAMVLAVTGAAQALGPTWTGLFAAFPVMSTVLAVFSHRANGAGFVVTMLRSMATGFYAFISYCTVFALALPSAGVAMAVTFAVVAAVAVQGLTRAVVLGRSPPGS